MMKPTHREIGFFQLSRYSRVGDVGGECSEIAPLSYPGKGLGAASHELVMVNTRHCEY